MAKGSPFFLNSIALRLEVSLCVGEKTIDLSADKQLF